MPIDTSKVDNRRQLHFDKIEDILAEVERLQAGKFQTLGNWSGGQILKHLSIPMNGCIDGVTITVPWYLRLLGRYYFKGRILKHGMKPGFQVTGPAADRLLPPESTTWEDGRESLRNGIKRLQTESKRGPHPILGPLTREEWDRIHCRHAELHLGFLIPEL